MFDDARKLALAHWLSQIPHAPAADQPLHSIASDAGFRRYFRAGIPGLLAVDAPPQTEDTRQFVALARFFSSQGINTPNISAADETQGFLLIEDFGDQQLYHRLDPHQPSGAYEAAFDTLISLQRCCPEPSLIPRYERALLRQELDIFNDWFVTQLLGYTLSDAQRQQLDSVFEQLETSALEQPQCLVHRDFHSRNLMVCANGQLGVIDFQGALWGAATYDLVSLLRDCYIRWPAAQVQRWALDYRQLAIAAELLEPISETRFLRWFDWMGLQRHIKVLGIFARLHLRDGKSTYLNDLPLVIRYCLEVAEQYPELQDFANWFKQELLPLAQDQAWYRDYRHAGEPQAAPGITP